MRELFLDTETTGFVQRSLPRDHEKQPHLVQLAMILRDDGKEVSSAALVVQCPVEVPEKAKAIHGYDKERTLNIGVPSKLACELFYGMARNADLIVAHNAMFDRDIVEIALTRSRVPIPWIIQGDQHTGRPFFCTMHAAEPHCKIPATSAQIRAGFKKKGDFKKPKLEEALQILVGEKLENAHDALADVRACMRVYDWLVASGNAELPGAA